MATEGWQVDRKIQLPLIFAIFVQTAGAFWWASGVNSRVEALEKQAIVNSTNSDRLTRVEVRLDGMADGITEIRALLRPVTRPARGG